MLARRPLPHGTATRSVCRHDLVASCGIVKKAAAASASGLIVQRLAILRGAGELAPEVGIILLGSRTSAIDGRAWRVAMDFRPTCPLGNRPARETRYRDAA